MNTRWSNEEHIYSIEDAGIRTILYDAVFDDAVRVCAARVRSVSNLIVFAGPRSDAAIDYEELIAGSVPADPVRAPLSDPSGIFYTGGTTGLPKGVVHTSSSIGTAALVSSLDMSPPPTPRYLHAAPMFHLGDLSQAFITTLLGGSHVFLPTFNAEEVVRLIEKHRVQTTLLVPTMIGMVLQSEAVSGADLSSLKMIAYPGSFPAR